MLTTKNWRGSWCRGGPALGCSQFGERWRGQCLTARRFSSPVGAAAWVLAVPLGWLLVGVLTGCTPAGPQALLDGERLLHAGQYSRAVDRLRVATKALPANAQAWNHLGLAYHYAGQPDPALAAYEQARRIDQNLTAVRYNLGCLLLEQNRPQAAIAELTAYTLLQRDTPDGWLKLGVAQLRANQYDQAERSLQNALQLRPDWPEAWNVRGVLQAQRRRAKEALNCFNLALQKQSDYPPALLNLAILQQSQLTNRSLALERYQEFLDLYPGAADAAAIREIVRQLRAELTPPARRPATNQLAAAPASRTAESAGAAQPPSTPRDPVPQRSTAPAVISNLVSNLTKPAAIPGDEHRPPAREAGLPSAAAAPGPSSAPAVQIQTPAPPPSPAEALTNNVEPSPPPKVEVVQIPEEAPPKVAQDARTSREQSAAAANPVTTTLPAPPPASTARPAADLVSETPGPGRQEDSSQAGSDFPPVMTEGADQPRRGIGRLNPANWFRGRRSPATPGPLELAGGDTAQATISPAGAAPRVGTEFTPSQRRYAYQSPKPARGDRVQADPFFAQAVRAHREGRLAEAIAKYREAVQRDPGFFEAQYNLGLAAYELKDWTLSLSAYETALSTNPTSANGRYNFALALEQAGYYQDAAREYETAIEQHPGETRAHFSLAKLAADRLGRLDLARYHYRKVLELDPQHPQASAIRFWLAANP